MASRRTQDLTNGPNATDGSGLYGYSGSYNELVQKRQYNRRNKCIGLPYLSRDGGTPHMVFPGTDSTWGNLSNMGPSNGRLIDTELDSMDSTISTCHNCSECPKSELRIKKSLDNVMVFSSRSELASKWCSLNYPDAFFIDYLPGLRSEYPVSGYLHESTVVHLNFNLDPNFRNDRTLGALLPSIGTLYPGIARVSSTDKVYLDTHTNVMTTCLPPHLWFNYKDIVAWPTLVSRVTCWIYLELAPDGYNVQSKSFTNYYGMLSYAYPTIYNDLLNASIADDPIV